MEETKRCRIIKVILKVEFAKAKRRRSLRVVLAMGCCGVGKIKCHKGYDARIVKAVKAWICHGSYRLQAWQEANNRVDCAMGSQACSSDWCKIANRREVVTD